MTLKERRRVANGPRSLLPPPDPTRHGLAAYPTAQREAAEIARARMAEPNDPPSVERIAEAATFAAALGLHQKSNRVWRGACPMCGLKTSLTMIAISQRVVVRCDSGVCDDYAKLEAFIAGRLAHDGHEGFAMGRD
jgi:hypothetical protein